MKALENYFKSKEINGAQYGIVYNLDKKKEIRYWNKDGKEVTIAEAPFDMEQGIFCFRSVNGNLTILEE
ncbi:MAG: hypothetical protein VYD54_02775 [Bdellovibrionota bacterium]|nr:hypothetical protein [Bdellovibrionota bacterium]